MLTYLLMFIVVGYAVGYACYWAGGSEPFLKFLPLAGMAFNLFTGGLLVLIVGA